MVIFFVTRATALEFKVLQSRAKKLTPAPDKDGCGALPLKIQLQ